MTKKELEIELSSAKRMYKEAHAERMYYFHLLSDIAYEYRYCALNKLTEPENKKYMINDKEICDVGEKLIEVLQNEIKRAMKEE